MTAYYNEIDKKAAAWLRELIAQGHIAPGDVDSRSIEDVTPNDLRGYTQCHFFAGIGVWSYALRCAGWADDRPVWTGSCPCQPFSAAGKGGGFDDERHLWPAWFWLIEQCRPAIVFGEQVASKDAEPWIDLVQDDLEALGYGVGAVPFPAAGVGAPHIRDRLYWVADSQGARGRQQPRSVPSAPSSGESEVARQGHGNAVGTDRATGILADAGSAGPSLGSIADDGRRTLRNEGPTAPPSELSRELADAVESGRARLGWRGQKRAAEHRDAGGVGFSGSGGPPQGSEAAAADRHGHPLVAASGGHSAGPTNGLWRDADWLLCRDGKWRPVEPGTFPLAHGAPARVGRLRGYGNGLVAPAAQAWIETYLDAEVDRSFRVADVSTSTGYSVFD